MNSTKFRRVLEDKGFSEQSLMPWTDRQLWSLGDNFILWKSPSLITVITDDKRTKRFSGYASARDFICQQFDWI